jgi:tetratricopeptide (TPR) repeat protein
MGIPITRFIQNVQKVGVALPATFNIPATEAQNPSSDDYFIAAADKYIRPGGEVAQSRQEAIGYLNTALVNKPDYAYGFFLRGYLQGQNKNYSAELSDYNRAIALNPNYLEVYMVRAVLKQAFLGDTPGALADYNQAIAIDGNYGEAYQNRGALKVNYLKDPQGALADYNRAIAIPYGIASLHAPNGAEAYAYRALLKQYNLRDKAGAILQGRHCVNEDMRTAARLYKSRGRQREYQLTVKFLQELGTTP